MLIFLCTSSVLLSENNFSKFNKYLENSDLKSAKHIIDTWGDNKLKDPQYYICQFNYYVNKSKTSGVRLQTQLPNNKTSFQLSDPKTGKVTAYLFSDVHYDRKIINKGINFIKRGIKLFPDHFEMRFGLMWCYKELYQLDSYLVEFDDALKYLTNHKNKKIYWNNNIVLESPKKFIFGSSQGNFGELFSNRKIKKINIFLHKYCDIMIKYFPNHKYGYTNKASLYYYTKEDKKSLKYFLIAHNKDKKDELIICNLGVFYMTIGENKKAKHYFNIILKSSENPRYIGLAKRRLKILSTKK